MSFTDESRLASVRKDIDTVDTKVNIAARNGLFKNQTAVTVKSIQDKLKKARIASDQKNLSESETQMSLASSELSLAINSTKKTWRLLNVYAIHIWIYLVSFLVGIFFFYYYSTRMKND